MARPGPAPKPRELKLVQGTLRKDRDVSGKVELEPKAPTCPKHLDRIAKAEWKRIVPILLGAGLLTQVDRAALAAYCQSYSRWVQAEEDLAKNGWTFETEKGFVGARPEVNIANQALKEMRALLQEFGMTPSARTRVRPAKPKEKSNPFKAL